MRVTNEMISNQVIFNLSQNIERFLKLQNQMSTNKRINKASDDPVGTVRDLGYRDRLSEIDQNKSNISIGQTWLQSTDSALNDINTAIADARSIAVEMSNDTFDETARTAAASEVQSLLDKILGAGNTQIQGSYLFAGYKTRTKPFEVSSNGAVYKGDTGKIEYKIDSNTKVQINTVGSNLLTKAFSVIGATSDLNAGIAGTTDLAILNKGQGVDRTPGTFVVKDQNLNTSVTIDISAATTVSDAITAINTQLTAGGMTTLTASLGVEGNNIRIVAADSPAISLNTALVNLNKGTGIDMVPGKFVIHNSSNMISATIDLTGAVTVGDAINAINAQLTSAGVTNVTASLNAGNTGIDITDSNVAPLGLTVSELSTSDFTAANLGLTGAIGPVLNGADLNPKPSFLVTETAPGETTAGNLGIAGQFGYSMIGSGLEPQLQPTTPLSLLNNSQGVPGGVIKIAQGDKVANIDTGNGTIITVQDLITAINNSGLTVTASINADKTGIQVTNNDPSKTLIIDNVGFKKTASSLGISGSSDVIGSLMMLIDSLRNNDRSSVSNILGTLDSSLNSVLNERSVAGAKVTNMTSTLSRLDQYSVNYTKLLSDVEDADVTQVITDLAMAENAYNAALSAAGKIIQPSLLNFIK